MPSIDTARNLIRLRNRDRNEDEDEQYYLDYYDVNLDKLQEIFAEIAVATRPLLNENNREAIGLAWFLVGYELGRSHQSVIQDIERG